MLIFFFSLLFSVAFAQEELPPRPYFALDCPGKGLELSFRHEWEKSGFEFINPPDEDVHWYAYLSGAWTRSQKLDYRRALEKNLGGRGQPKDIGDGALNWRKGIQLIPSALGLPDQIDGCRVVPIAAYYPHDSNNREYLFLASTDDFVRLLKADQALLVLHAEKMPEELLRHTFSKASQKFTWKEKFRILSEHEITSINFYRDKVWGSAMVQDCEWWDDNTPKKCTVTRDNSDPWRRNWLWTDSVVTFWPNGYIHTGELYSDQDLIENLVCRNPQGCKFARCSGKFSYLENGQFEKAEFCRFP